jgi:hypothetical protein
VNGYNLPFVRGCLQSSPLAIGIALLRQKRIDFSYWTRAASITEYSLMNSLFRWYEKRKWLTPCSDHGSELSLGHIVGHLNTGYMATHFRVY